MGRSYVLQSLALRFHCTHDAEIMESLLIPMAKLPILGGHDLD